VSAPDGDALDDGSDDDLERLFHAALARPRGERAAFLRRHCGDARLRDEVAALLDADEQAAGFLELAATPPEGRIGPYRLLRKIGEGGTSIVYLAARADDQYRQHVAVKLIKPGLSSQQILRRFRRERQILAGLGHPHIARILDGGSTPDGHPYFVMEHIEGQPLDAHCQKQRPSLDERLELFRVICQAVHFAHQNLVVHRDLKPSNILVDKSGAPKLLDFGIAKLLGPAATATLDATLVGRVMTPHYASPEQVQGGPISTASDVYSLGVILYELVTGRRPYEIKSPSLGAIERVVCGEMPPPPSQRLDGPRPPRWPSDLDNIVLMALRKEPERRYASAQELADDLRRCRERRPVIARPDTLAYRLSSFVRRNRGAVAAGLLVIVCLVGGAVATTWQWRRAVAQRARAQAQKARAEQTLAFLVDLFKVPDAAVDGGRVPARALLDRGAERLRRGGPRPPDVRATLEHTLGVVYSNLGVAANAASLLQDAADARARDGGADLERADSLCELAAVRWELGQPYVAERLLHEALAIRTRRLGAADLGVADVLARLAELDAYLDRRAEAERDARRALSIRRQRLDAGDARVADSELSLAAVLSTFGRYDEAEPLLRQALAIRRQADEDRDLELGRTLGLLSVLRLNQGYFDDAEQKLDEALAHDRRALGPDHPAVVDADSIHVPIWRQQGRYDEAEALARSSLLARRALRGEDHPAVDNALAHLAAVLYERGTLAEAESTAATALAMRERAYGRFHASVGTSAALLGEIALAKGDIAGAEARFGQALAVWRRTLGDDHPDLARALLGLARTRAAQQQRAEARRLAGEALALQRRRLRPGHPAIADALELLGELALGDAPATAEPLLRETWALRQAALPAAHPGIARAESLLGACLAARGHAVDGVAMMRRAHEQLRRYLGAAHVDTERAWQRLHAVAADP
jgi:serine/threonine-protein kinase